MRERNHAFDILCGICIIRMVSLHIMAFCGQEDQEWWGEVMRWSFFFMSFFFFKAGFFNKGTSSGTDMDYLKDRSKRLLVPYVTSGVIGLVVYFSFYFPLVDRYKKFVEPLEWSHIWMKSGFYGNSPIWFLFSFFVVYMMVRYIDKVKHLCWLTVFFPAISYWAYRTGNNVPMSLGNVFIACYFFYLGRLWQWAMCRFEVRRLMAASWLMVLLFVVLGFVAPGTYNMSQNIFTGNALMAVVRATLVLCGLSGVLLTARVPRIPWLCFIGEHSMVFFISHYPMLYFYKFTHLSFGRSIYGRVDDALILLPVVFCICSWLVPYVERVPWLSGRWPGSRRASAEAVPHQD
ncbi:MAG: acyltransferase [Bacteroidaceae bacterium]|nr:acyltransferase [Bacteroidaceae bacterium]MBQ5681097.1 acyltransferase [Bacteroidaceae bacterium]